MYVGIALSDATQTVLYNITIAKTKTKTIVTYRQQLILQYLHKGAIQNKHAETALPWCP